MARFGVHTQSAATIGATREAVWAAVTDPELLPRLTPFLRDIEVDGDRWTWHLARVPVLGLAVAPSFTELMTFVEPERIAFVPAAGSDRAGVEGSYRLAETASGTRLSIELTIGVDLPFPRLMRPAVETAMRAVVATMGARFSANLLRHLARG